jgi:hypothetical protein
VGRVDSRFISTDLDRFVGHVVYQLYVNIDTESKWLAHTLLVVFYCDYTTPGRNWARLVDDNDLFGLDMNLWQFVTAKEASLGDGMALRYSAFTPSGNIPAGTPSKTIAKGGRTVKVEASILETSPPTGRQRTHVVRVVMDRRA